MSRSIRSLAVKAPNRLVMPVSRSAGSVVMSALLVRVARLGQQHALFRGDAAVRDLRRDLLGEGLLRVGALARTELEAQRARLEAETDRAGRQLARRRLGDRRLEHIGPVDDA